MTQEDDKLEPYDIDPPYAQPGKATRPQTRLFFAWCVAIAGIAVIGIALLSYMVWPPGSKADPATTAAMRSDRIGTPGTAPDASATTIDRSPSPSGSGSGPTGVTSPSGSEKVQ
ncbi:hypothetical protein ASE04_05725 [Rhizobium sp. Root708]|uniref:hypothetical protein n=1 Tax=Rhizobium sp. Root708 TaxID=1736592 RepID=UPI0006F3037C|nr:hypothetical protein [Rhizobium sp. Root708]KRB55206.1 hypothetical protein ASE04_05725 [Rhizobium sp. Root708]